jgi:hypothetical protein
MSAKQETKWLGRPRSKSVDRRAWVRYPGLLNASFHVAECDTDRGWWARIKNVSRSGVCVVLPRRVPLGTRLLFELPGDLGQPRDTVLMCVLHTTQEAGANWLTGCEFVRQLSQEELRTLRQSPS